MTVTVQPPPPPPLVKNKARVLQLVPPGSKLLDTDAKDVTAKLKRALCTAQSGNTSGAMIIALDQAGGWSVELAGRFQEDEGTVCQIACSMLDACLSVE